MQQAKNVDTYTYYIVDDTHAVYYVPQGNGVQALFILIENIPAGSKVKDVRY